MTVVGTRPTRTSALLFIIFMLFSAAMPAHAYFTTEHPEVSASLTFLICNRDSGEYTGAGLALPRPFLFEAEDSGGGESVPDDGVFLMTSGPPSPLYTDVRQPEPGERLEAEITIPGGFDFEKVFIPSVKLHYEDKTWFALNGRLMETSLVVYFDFYELWDWFREDLYICDYITLTVSGEGYREDGGIFFFSGETTVQLSGRYDIRETAISGPDVIAIAPGDTVTCQYMLVDQDGLFLPGADWTLAEETEGVQIGKETGVLSAGEEAAGHTVVITAAFESQGRLHLSRKEVQLVSCSNQEIPGETAGEDPPDENSEPAGETDDTEISPPNGQGNEYHAGQEDEPVAVMPEEDEVLPRPDSESIPDSGGGGAESGPAATESSSKNIDL